MSLSDRQTEKQADGYLTAFVKAVTLCFLSATNKMCCAFELNGSYVLMPFSHFLCSFFFQCAMVESHLSDVITLHTDVTGYLIGISIVTLPGACRGVEVEDEVDLESFNTTLTVMAPVNAPP